MITVPPIDPVAIQLGPVSLHWYGLMYVIGIAAAWWLGNRRAAAPNSGWTHEQVSDLVFYAALGAVLGGRIGYMFFYDLPVLLADPLRLFRVWEGGMSFHGGLLGVLLAFWLLGRSQGKGFFTVADFAAPLVPIGLGAGRIGNFINGELWGRVSDVPWAMVFQQPGAGGLPRHPSQLYEALLEGLVLFVLLWWYSGRPRPPMAVSGLFLLGYAVFRFAVEFVRLPDAHLGYQAWGWLTRGQILTMPMALLGMLLLWLAYRRQSA